MWVGEIANGAIEKGAISLGTFTPDLEVSEVSVMPRLAIPPLPFPNRDFWGNVVEEGERFPGPFQNWPEEGSVRWHLWPVEVSD
ncbi:hypothetical protein AY599_15430 [Leptolyngbya valderiana BDU 20041]|nr:hypothetical protein AY599_15430 [Leptolyngbya valderiana BDU 20041]